MIGIFMILVIAGLIVWGIFLYRKVDKLDQVIAKHLGAPSETGDDD